MAAVTDTTPNSSPPVSPSHARAGGGELEGDELKAAILNQVEYYFSATKLAKDTYLVSQMNTDLYVTIELIANFAKMKSYTTDLALVVEILQTSTKLEVRPPSSLAPPYCRA
eukprot:SAG22_NODE_4814_length_1158_cov_0.971671_2_plen_111_part_01